MPPSFSPSFGRGQGQGDGKEVPGDHGIIVDRPSNSPSIPSVRRNACGGRKSTPFWGETCAF